MTETILCLVALFFLAWVIILKLEIERLKSGDRRSASRASGGESRGGAVKGMRSFKID